MAIRVGTALGLPGDEQAVRLGLVRLERAHLLDSPGTLPLHRSRREMLRTLGRAAVALVPLVTALSVPTSAQAANTGCGPTGQPCNGPGDCCSGQCVGNPKHCK